MLARRLLFSALLMVVAAIAAGGGVMLWRTLNPPPLRVSAPTLPSGLSASNQTPTLSVGDMRPELKLRDLTGRYRSISEWDGKLLFVNFWASWCPPCVDEIPSFIRLQAAHANEGVQFLGVALDSPENVRSFMAEHGMNYPSLHGEEDAIDAVRSFGNQAGGLPYTVVVGRDGRVLLQHMGVLPEAEAKALIAANR